MAFQCGFFNSVNGDRKYNAEQMNNPYSRIVSNGVFGSAESSTDFQVKALGDLNITVKQGEGIFANKWAKLDADMPFTVPTPHVSMTRIDSIIIRIDTSNEVRAGTIEYKQGTPASNPVAIELENSNYVKEYRLAKITVAPNINNITQSKIEDCRPTSECGFIHNLLWESDISTTYSQWQAQFEEWFNNLRLTLSTVTAITSFTSKYVTTEQDEVNIPIQISRYNSVLDILQVYINGLICIEGVDYTITDNETIQLTNGVDAGTLISFIVYKSVDGTEAENVIDQINELYTRVEKLESKTDDALWVGASTMGDGVRIEPSKKLSECKNGWLLCWCDYDESTEKSTDSQFVFSQIPKNILKNIQHESILSYFTICSGMSDDGSFLTTVKRLICSDVTILGYIGNTATVDGKDTCLKAIYEY